MPTDENLFQHRTQLEGRKKNLEADLKATKAEIASVSDRVLESFAEDGVSSVTLDTGETVYMHAQPHVSVKADDWDRLAEEVDYAATIATSPSGYSPEAIARFKAVAELAGMMQRRINLTTLTAWCKERITAFNEHTVGMSDDEIEVAFQGPRAPLPGMLADLITLITKPTVRVRGVKAK